MQHVGRGHVLSPFLMARVSGIEPSILSGLVLTSIITDLAEVLSHEREIDNTAARLTEALYDIVPRLEGEQEARRITLDMKRAIHNRRSATPPPHWLACVRAQLDAADGALLNEWLERMSAREEKLADLAQRYTAAVEAASFALSRAMRKPAVEQGVALASPAFWAGVLRADAVDWQPGSGLAKTAVTYLARTALKTSPFSTLTLLDLSTRGESGYCPRVMDSDRYLRAAQSLITTLSLTFACHPQYSKSFMYRVNESLRQSGGNWKVLAADYSYTGEFAWRNERFVDVTALQEVVQHLTPGAIYSFMDLTTTLSGADTIPRLVRSSVLLPVLDFPGDGGSLRSIVAWLQQLTPNAVAIHAPLRRADESIVQLATADGHSRISLVAGVRNCVVDAFTALGVDPPDWLNRASVVYEDVRSASCFPALPTKVEEDLDELCRQLRPCIARSHLYDAVVDRFVDEYGARGECRDVMAFLTGFQSDHAALKAQREAVTKDKAIYANPSQERAGLCVSESTAPPTVSIYAQLAADSERALQQGDYLLICNQVTPGLGGAFSRFTSLFGANHQSLAQGLGDWLQACYHGAEPLDVMVAGDWNNAQIHRPVTNRVLQWPLELLPPGLKSVSLLDLRIVHEQSSNTLTLTDRAGRTVAPVYASTVPHYLVWGPLRTLMLLINPWFVAAEFGAGNFFLRAVPSPPSRVVYTERRQWGRIVTKRAQWHLPPHLFPTRTKAETDFAYFVRVQRWRHEWGIPEEVFLSVSVEGLPLDGRTRKPVWLHFGSPHALEAVRPMLSAAAACVTLTECLPRRDQCWFRTSDGSLRATEIQVMARWPRPSAP